MIKKKKNEKNEKNEKSALKQIMKKNQVVILTLALMLMTAGYMNYTNNQENENTLLAQLGDAQLVSTNAMENTVENDVEEVLAQGEENEIKEDDEEEKDEDSTEVETSSDNINNTENVINNEVLETNTESLENNQAVETVSKQNENTDEYFTKSKLERETMYSQMLETYKGILENEKIASDQKKIAENEIKNINDNKNAIMIVENLLKSKNFENVIVFINSPSVNVIIKGEKLSQEQVAQVQNIVQRELKTEIENIHISTKK